MANVFIIGATGGIGSRLAVQLVARGDQPVGLHRRPDQARALEECGVRPVAGDLTSISVKELAAHFKGMDAIVFAAGASEDGPRIADAVDGQGVVKAASAAQAAGVRRFLHVSAFPDAWRDQRMPPAFEHYMKVKRQADVHLASTDLDWVIVRPGALSSQQGTGKVRIGMAIPYGEVPRDDVAAVLAELVHTPRIKRIILELTSGDTAVHAALAGAVDGAIQAANRIIAAPDFNA
jgi:uncharacterized protein YbjT (DUF2867 family)